MNTLENNTRGNVEVGLEELINSVQPSELGILREYVELPEYPDFETLSSFIIRHGRGVFADMIEKAERARDAVGLSYTEFQATLLHTLGQLHE